MITDHKVLSVQRFSKLQQSPLTCRPASPSADNGVNCDGPFTEWGLPYGGFDGNFDTGIPIGNGSVTSIDIYLDTAFAAAARTSGKDYRFDWDSDLLDSKGQFLQDYIFNVATAQTGDVCGVSNGYVVEASTNSQRMGRRGSDSPKTEAPSTAASIVALRNELRRQGVFAEQPDKLVLAHDYSFSSPSQAASALLGRTANGRIERGYGDAPPETVITIGFSREFLESRFASCRLAAQIRNRYGVVNRSYLQGVFVCRGLNEGWPKFWDELPRFG